MEYDLMLTRPGAGRSSIELDRVAFLAKHIKRISKMAFLLKAYGYSKIGIPKSLEKYLEINFKHTTSFDDRLIFHLESEPFDKFPQQLSLFNNQLLRKFSPVSLVVSAFAAALNDNGDKNDLDEPLLVELIKFKSFFENDDEQLVISNRNSIPEVKLSRSDIGKITTLAESSPKNRKATVSGMVDEMALTKQLIVIKTAENAKLPVKVQSEMFAKLKEHFGKVIEVTGNVVFRPGGNASHIVLESFKPESSSSKFFSKIPKATSLQQEISLQMRLGKSKNPVASIFGKWPEGGTDTEFEFILRELD